MNPVQPNRSNFAWLADTYWYVRSSDVAALAYDVGNNTLGWKIDQTVWHITGYRDGYFWGVTAVLTRDAGAEVPARGRGSKPVGFAMLGSITPEGRVHLTFIPDKAHTSRSATIGIGRAIEHEGSVSLEMQMSTGSTDRTAHWAYMAQTTPEDPSWSSLPGVGLSVPEMLDGIDPPELAAP